MHQKRGGAARTASDPESAAQKERGARLVAVRNLLEFSQKEAAEYFHVGVSTWQRYEAGDDINGAVLALLSLSNVDVNWLLTGQGDMLIDPGPAAGAVAKAAPESQEPYWRSGISAGDFYPVPRYDARASAGAGAVAEGADIKDHLMFRVDWIRRELGTEPAKLGCMDLAGDSMEPLIPNGATILFDRAIDRLADEAIYVLELDGALVVKRVQKLMGGAVLHSENQRYEPTTLDADQATRLGVIGRVRWFGRVI